MKGIIRWIPLAAVIITIFFSFKVAWRVAVKTEKDRYRLMVGERLDTKPSLIDWPEGFKDPVDYLDYEKYKLEEE